MIPRARRDTPDQAKTDAVLGSDGVTDTATGKPAVTWTVVVRRTRDTTEAEEERKDTFVSLRSAKEFATEWVAFMGCYDARVVNSKGVTVWEARKSGVRYDARLGGKRRGQRKTPPPWLGRPTRRATMIAKQFHPGDALSVTTGNLHGPNGMDGVYKILAHLTGFDVYTHQIPRVLPECQSHLRAQLPHLPAEGYTADVAEIERLYGTAVEVSPMTAGVVVCEDPVAELMDKAGKNRVVVVVTPDPTDRPPG